MNRTILWLMAGLFLFFAMVGEVSPGGLWDTNESGAGKKLMALNVKSAYQGDPTRPATTRISSQGQPTDPAILVSPEGDTSTLAPTYVWHTPSGSSLCRLFVADTAAILIELTCSAEANCLGWQCSVRPPNPLPPGRYTWMVFDQNNSGFGHTSDKLTFSIIPGIPGTPVPSYLIDIAEEVQPTYRWGPVKYTPGCRLRIQDVLITVTGLTPMRWSGCRT